MSNKLLNQFRDGKKQLSEGIKKDWIILQEKYKEILSVFPDVVAPWIIDGTITVHSDNRPNLKQIVISILSTDAAKRLRTEELCKKITSHKYTSISNVLSNAIRDEEIINGFHIRKIKADGESFYGYYKEKV